MTARDLLGRPERGRALTAQAGSQGKEPSVWGYVDEVVVSTRSQATKCRDQRTTSTARAHGEGSSAGGGLSHPAKARHGGGHGAHQAQVPRGRAAPRAQEVRTGLQASPARPMT